MAVTNTQGLPRYFPSPDCEIQFGFKRAECKPQMARFLPDLAVTLWSLCRNSRLAIQTTTCAPQTAEPSERGKGSNLFERNPIDRVNDHISQDMPSTLPTASKRHAHGDSSSHEAMGTAIGPKVILLRTSLRRETRYTANRASSYRPSASFQSSPSRTYLIIHGLRSSRSRLLSRLGRLSYDDFHPSCWQKAAEI